MRRLRFFQTLSWHGKIKVRQNDDHQAKLTTLLHSVICIRIFPVFVYFNGLADSEDLDQTAYMLSQVQAVTDHVKSTSRFS